MNGMYRGKDVLPMALGQSHAILLLCAEPRHRPRFVYGQPPGHFGARVINVPLLGGGVRAVPPDVGAAAAPAPAALLEAAGPVPRGRVRFGVSRHREDEVVAGDAQHVAGMCSPTGARLPWPTRQSGRQRSGTGDRGSVQRRPAVGRGANLCLARGHRPHTGHTHTSLGWGRRGRTDSAPNAQADGQPRVNGGRQTTGKPVAAPNQTSLSRGMPGISVDEGCAEDDAAPMRTLWRLRPPAASDDVWPQLGGTQL